MELLVCPVCGAPLDDLACGCGRRYPRLAGVPILVPEPERWLGRHRDAVLATLAERGAADATTVAMVLERAAVGEEPLRFGDDWVERPAVPRAPAVRALAEAPGPAEVALELLGPSPGRVLEIGCGDGGLTRPLASRCERLIAGDLSLRAVLRATAGTTAEPVVLDAEALPVALDALDAVVAVNVVDLLDEADDFLALAAGVLRPGGRLVLSTPDPGLGSADEGALASAITVAGLVIDVVHDPVPWVHAHTPRYQQVWSTQVLRAVRR